MEKRRMMVFGKGSINRMLLLIALIIIVLSFFIIYHYSSKEAVMFGPLDPPDIYFSEPTPENNSYRKDVVINVSIIEEISPLSEFILDWNGTDYSAYDPSLILLMNFDNESALGENDTHVKDVSIYGNNGSATNATWESEGKYHGAYNFNINSSYIRVLNSSSLELGGRSNNSYTLSAWIFPISYGEYPTYGYGRIIDKSIPGTNAGGGYYLAVVANAGGHPESLSVTHGGVMVYSDSNILSLNRWQYVSVVFIDPGIDNGSVIFFVDGERKGNTTITNDPGSGSGDLLIGAGTREGYTRDFNGSIDEIKIWNRTLSDEEINFSYHSNLKKYDAVNWMLSANMSSKAIENNRYRYFASVSDSGGKYNATDTRELVIGEFVQPPSIYYTIPTPENGSTLMGNNIYVNISISEANLRDVKFNWKQTNYTIFNDSIVLLMNFDNRSLGENDTHVKDVSIYGNNGTVNGPILISGKYDRAFNFDGVDDNIIVKDSPSLDIYHGQFTVAFWIYPRNITNNLLPRIFEKRSEYAAIMGNTTNGMFGRMTIKMLDIGGTITGEFWSNSQISLNKWEYWTFAYNGTNGTWYLNGEEDGVRLIEPYGAWIGNEESTAGYDLYIAKMRTDMTRNFNGSIDQFTMWNRMLNGSEIKQMYYSNLHRYNQSQWYLYMNLSSLAYGDYNFFSCAKNPLKENCTLNRAIKLSASPTPTPEEDDGDDGGGGGDDTVFTPRNKTNVSDISPNEIIDDVPITSEEDDIQIEKTVIRADSITLIDSTLGEEQIVEFNGKDYKLEFNLRNGDYFLKIDDKEEIIDEDVDKVLFGDRELYIKIEKLGDDGIRASFSTERGLLEEGGTKNKKTFFFVIVGIVSLIIIGIIAAIIFLVIYNTKKKRQVDKANKYLSNYEQKEEKKPEKPKKQDTYSLLPVMKIKGRDVNKDFSRI